MHLLAAERDEEKRGDQKPDGPEDRRRAAGPQRGREPERDRARAERRELAGRGAREPAELLSEGREVEAGGPEQSVPRDHPERSAQILAQEQVEDVPERRG